MIIKRGSPIENYQGKRWIVTNVKRATKTDAIAYFKSKLIIDEQIADAPDGVYTWAIVNDHLLMLPVLNAQEVGALHINMLMWAPTEINTDGVVIAGELRKTGSIVNYNLKSGTFMEKFITGKDEAYVQTLVTAVTDKFLSLEIIANFLKCKPCTHEYEKLSGESIIDTEGIKTSDEEMAILMQYFNMESAAAEENSLENIFGGFRRTKRLSKRHGVSRQGRNKNLDLETRRVSTGHSVSRQGAKNLTRHRRTKRQVRQKNDFYNVSADFRHFR